MTKAEQPTITQAGLQEDMALISATYLKLTADAENDFSDVDAAMDRVSAALRTTSLAAQDGIAFYARELLVQCDEIARMQGWPNNMQRENLRAALPKIEE